MDKVTVKHIDEMHSGEHAGPQKILDVAHDLGDPSVFVRVGDAVARRIVPGDVGATILAIGRA